MAKSSPIADMTAEELASFDWLNLHNEMNKLAHEETKLEKLIRKTSENPMVPLGAAATMFALVYGVWNFGKGRSQMSQYMMRTRVGAQGFTVLALVLGYVYGIDRK